MGGVPSWGAAAAIPSERGVVVYRASPRVSEDEARRILAHELGHLTLYLWAGGHPLPRWFDEGVVQYWSSIWRLETTVRLARAWRGGDFPALDDLDDLLELPESQAQVAYAVAFDAVRRLVTNQGPEVIGLITDRMAQGEPFGRAFAEAAGQTVATFELAWKNEMVSRFRWAVWLEWPVIFGILLVALFFMALAARQVQRRRQLARWRDEEGEHDFE